MESEPRPSRRAVAAIAAHRRRWTAGVLLAAVLALLQLVDPKRSRRHLPPVPASIAFTALLTFPVAALPAR